ncbi:FG-GAP repeat domain-containing protein [Streptomyces sp. NPDC014656]|uniref:FG-GAP repeat domain-containing protein n=1 Tax=Streptomyces sp. NPDC014656 TaxID=3364878 RepID=UPI0036FAD8BF
MKNTSRRALRLASTLAAAGLALSAVPAVHADDGSGMLTLSEAQAETLQEQVRLDPYNQTENHVTDGVDAPGASDDRESDEGASGGTADGTSDNSDTTADPGTTGDSAAIAAGGVTVTTKGAVEGVQGMADTVPLAGTDGDYLAISSLGVIQRLHRDGGKVWSRANASYYDDWKVTPLRVWQKDPKPVRVLMGYNAVSPFTPASDLGYDTGDLTGDGVADLAVTMSVGIDPYRPFTSPGSALPNGTFVSVLDGGTGETLWSKLYAYAGAVRLAGDTLVIADSPAGNLNRPAGATATLNGIRFGYADGKLTPAATWTHDTGRTGTTYWGGLQELPGGKVAASFNDGKTTAIPAAGHTVVVDTADGKAAWQEDGTLYSRQLEYDAGRGRIVALEQSAPTDGVRYQVAAYDPADGTRTTLDTRINAVPLALEVGDLRGTEGEAEYAVSESTLDSYLNINSSSVRVLDGTPGSPQLWSYTLKRSGDGGSPAGIWGLDIVNRRLVATMQEDRGLHDGENRGGSRLARIAVLAGPTGKTAWEHAGVVSSPMFAQPWKDADGWHVRTADGEQNVLDYGLATGTVEHVNPLRGDVSYAEAVDVDGDGNKDVVMGGESRGLWAYDGPSWAAGRPKALWQAVMPGGVHGIELTDTDGDGRSEILVAADKAAVLVDRATGKVRTTIDAGGQYVHTVTGADLDGDGRSEIVVPTDRVRAYTAAGKLKWSYAAPESDVVFSDAVVTEGRVHVEYNTRGSIDVTTPAIDGVALDAVTGGLLWQARPKSPVAGVPLRAAVLRGGTFASKEIPYADGHAVVYSWVGRNTTGAATWPMFTEIRDGRTGEVLHSSTGGTFLLHGNYFAHDGGLYAVGYSAVHSWTAAGDGNTFMGAVVKSGGTAVGPGGRALFVAGSQTGNFVYDASVLTAGRQYPPTLASFAPLGAQRYLAADLDGDGVDELVGLNEDEHGYDRVAHLSGGGLYLPNDLIHYTAVGKLTAS